MIPGCPGPIWQATLKDSKRMYSAGGRKPFDRTEDQDGRVAAASG